MKKIAVGSLGEFWYGDFKEPFVQLEGALPGYPQGVLLKDNELKLLCPYCPDGRAFDNLGNHAAKTHGMTAKVFKDEVGLLRSSALVSERIRMLGSASAIRRAFAGQSRITEPAIQLKAARLGGQTAHAMKGRLGKSSPEALNKTGRCYAQIIAVAQTVLRETGRITEARMRQHGIHSRNTELYWGSWQNFLKAMGDRVERSGVTWTDRQLITVLQSLASELGHTPTVSDQRRYGLPSRKTFEHHFGSWTEACRRAGIPPNVPSEWARRAETDQEHLAVLSGYAMTGTMARAGKAAGISWQRATLILRRYGIEPLRQESPLRQQQMATAATIARRIADLPETREEVA